MSMGNFTVNLKKNNKSSIIYHIYKQGSSLAGECCLCSMIITKSFIHKKHLMGNAHFERTHLLCNTSIFFKISTWLFTDENTRQLLLHKPDRSTFCGKLRVSNHVTVAIVFGLIPLSLLTNDSTLV